MIQILLIVVILASDVVSLNLSVERVGLLGDARGSTGRRVLIAIAPGRRSRSASRTWCRRPARSSTRSARHLRQKWADAKEALRVLRRPKKVLLLLGGNLIAQVMLAIILGLCLKAFGQSASLAALILVNTFVSLFAGFMPVPGGRRRRGGLHGRL